MNFPIYADQLLEHRTRTSAGLVALENTDSTQILARRIVDEYVREGSAVPDLDIVAWSQGQGRGRHGRHWASPPGRGVYMTLIRSCQVRGWLQLLPLRVATALCEALGRHLGDRCRLKWPNDLLVGGRKLGGILIEAVTLGENGAVALVGCGVNHRVEAASLGLTGATSVRAEAPDAPPLADLARQLIAAVDQELAHTRLASDVVARYQAFSLHEIGDSLRCEIDGVVVEGRFLGFDEHGFLRLRSHGEERLISTGEILSGEP